MALSVGAAQTEAQNKKGLGAGRARDDAGDTVDVVVLERARVGERLHHQGLHLANAVVRGFRAERAAAQN